MTVESRRIRTLVMASVLGAVLDTLVRTCWFAFSSPTARVRDDIFAFEILRTLARLVHVEILSIVPVVFSVPFDLSSFTDALAYLSFGIPVSAVSASVLTLIALPILSLLRRIVYRTGPGGLIEPLWTRVIPLVTFGFFASPILHPLVASLISNNALLVAAILSAVGSTMAALFLFRDAGTITRNLRLGGTVAIAVAVLAASMALVTLRADKTGGILKSRKKAQGPNILLISIDSLRSDHLSSYGYDRATSPTIDRLSQEGVRFEEVVAPTSWTLPSHLTMLTSLPPELHGVVNSNQYLRRRFDTLAEVLQRSGYATAAMVSGPLVESRYGFAQGFETYDDYSIVAPTHAESHQAVTSPTLVEELTKWLGRWAKSERPPFFIFLHMWDVHYDYIPPAPYDRMFDSDYEGNLTSKDFSFNPDIRPDMDPRDLEHLIALYDGEIRYTDEHIGRIVALIEELGVLDRTIVAITADHGEEFFEHGEKGHKKNLYDESLLVPLVIRYPARIPAGSVVHEQVQLTDIGTSLLSLARIDVPSTFGSSSGVRVGQDLTPWIHGRQTEEDQLRPAFAGLHGEVIAVRTGNNKFIQTIAPGTSKELYDLRVDPSEKVNLIQEQQQQEVAARLSDVLDRWRVATTSGDTSTNEIRLNSEHIELLRSLGYVK